MAGRGIRLSVRRYWQLTGLLCAGCASWCHPNKPAPPPVSRVQVIPQAVTAAVAQGNSVRFKLEARLVTPAGDPIAESWGYQPVWAVVPTTALSVGAALGHDATVTMSGGQPQGPPLAGTVSANVDGATGAATITGVASPSDWAGDYVLAAHTDGQPPSLALFDGQTSSSSECVHDQIVGLVGVALLPNQGVGCGRVAVFSPDHAFVIKKVSWTASADVIDVRPDQGDNLLSVPVKIWIAIDNATVSSSVLDQWRESASGQALLDVQRAQAVFVRGRTGFLLVVPGGAATVLTGATQISEIGSTCADADKLAGDPSAPFKADTLNIYYVIGMTGQKRGLTCWESDGRAQYVVYVDWQKESPTTLAHELGHVLGLRAPDYGHTTFVPGFNYTNIMYEVDDAVANDRNALSLGQVFRMNVDGKSWVNLAFGAHVALNRSQAPLLQCQCETEQTTPCPQLALDVTVAPGVGQPVASGACAGTTGRTGTSRQRDMALLPVGRRREGQ